LERSTLRDRRLNLLEFHHAKAEMIATMTTSMRIIRFAMRR
jgi:hypothetical protein